MQAALDADVASLQYELMSPDDPSSVDAQAPSISDSEPSVVILGFNEASQVRGIF